VLVATGGSYYDSTSGDSVIAFALPKANEHNATDRQAR
jgi:hypothetical protein